MNYDESKHPRLKGKFASKNMSPADKKAHAVVPIKLAGITPKTEATATPVGDYKSKKKGKPRSA